MPCCFHVRCWEANSACPVFRGDEYFGGKQAHTPMNGIRFRRRCFLAVAVLLTLSCAAQPAPSPEKSPEWRGAWVASAGTRTFHGRWWARLLPKSRDGASGSWTLLSDSNQIVLEGTWSAQKSPQGWRGRWSARIGTVASISGSWTCNATGNGTFEQMLKTTLEKQVTGSWASGRRQGNWWLMGPG